MKPSQASRSVLAQKSKPIIIGWREWMALPDLHIPAIKVKVDTGARTSCLHALDIQPYDKDGVPHVRFLVPPLQQRSSHIIECSAAVIDQRKIRDSGGHTELRYVIKTKLRYAGRERQIDITLTHRKNMRFRMLLGRTALTPNLIVDAGASYRLGRGGPTT